MSLYTSTPIGGLASQKPEEEWLPYIQKIMAQPKPVSDLIFSPKTGAYLRGVAKQYDLPEEKEGQLAFLVLRVLIGELEPNQFAQTTAADLGIENERAAQLAKDIEHDLLSTVSGVKQTPEQIKERKARPREKNEELKNVLDLKKQVSKTPNPPCLPPKPPLPPNSSPT